MPTIADCISDFLQSVKDARATNTHRHHVAATKRFCDMLRKNNLDPQKESIDILTEDHMSKFIATLKKQLPGTEQVYIVDIKNFYMFLGAENIKQFNYPRIASIIKMKKRKPPVRLPQFPEGDITEFLEKIDQIIRPEHPFENTNEKLRAYRDRA